MMVLSWYYGSLMVLWFSHGIMVLSWYDGSLMVLWFSHGIMVLSWYYGSFMVLWFSHGIMVLSWYYGSLMVLYQNEKIYDSTKMVSRRKKYSQMHFILLRDKKYFHLMIKFPKLLPKQSVHFLGVISELLPF